MRDGKIGSKDFLKVSNVMMGSVASIDKELDKLANRLNKSSWSPRCKGEESVAKGEE
jgi:hypothetical protein